MNARVEEMETFEALRMIIDGIYRLSGSRKNVKKTDKKQVMIDYIDKAWQENRESGYLVLMNLYHAYNSCPPSQYLCHPIYHTTRAHFEKLRNFWNLDKEYKTIWDDLGLLVISLIYYCTGTRPQIKEIGNSTVGKITWRAFCHFLSNQDWINSSCVGSDHFVYTPQLLLDLAQDRQGTKGKWGRKRNLIDYGLNIVEKHRVKLTSDVLPLLKTLSAVLYLSKEILNPRYLLPELSETDVESIGKGKQAPYVQVTTFLGRMVGEVIDAWVNSMVGIKRVRRLVVIVDGYLSVFKLLGTHLESYEGGYFIEQVPAMDRYVYSLKQSAAESIVTERGLFRIGEVKNDVRDYLLHGIALGNTSRILIGEDAPHFSGFRRFSAERLILESTLERQ